MNPLLNRGMGDSDDAGDIVLTLLWHAIYLHPSYSCCPCCCPSCCWCCFCCWDTPNHRWPSFFCCPFLLLHPLMPLLLLPMLLLPLWCSDFVLLLHPLMLLPLLPLLLVLPQLHPLVGRDDARDVHTNLVLYHAIHHARSSPAPMNI